MGWLQDWAPLPDPRWGGSYLALLLFLPHPSDLLIPPSPKQKHAREIALGLLGALLGLSWGFRALLGVLEPEFPPQGNPLNVASRVRLRERIRPEHQARCNVPALHLCCLALCCVALCYVALCCTLPGCLTYVFFELDETACLAQGGENIIRAEGRGTGFRA